MKKISISILLMCVAFTAGACDICGCGVGSYYIGILPEFSKKIAGVRYRHNFLRTHLGAGNSQSYLTTDEIYRTAEVWGGWNIGKKLRLMGYIPISINDKTNQGVRTTKTGLGDMGVQAYYQLFDERKPISNKLLVHSLWLGAGVKAPTGKYDNAEKNGINQSANIFQLGTGSVDITFNTMYDIRLQDFGINTNVSYKVNTSNRYDYRYGNKLSINLQAYHKFRVKDKLTIAPNAGISYETADKDRDGKYRVDVSGGNILVGTLGLETVRGRWSIGGNFQTPFSQNLANGFVRAGNRFMIHTAFLL